MPPIKIQHVVSCSSEDKVHKGENLLSTDHYRKWKSATPGEKQITIILQLEKEVRISGIDIGNEGSALVEVLVGRSSDHNRDFEVLLVTSSFMSPKESRQETNLNQVRMFGVDKLTQSVAKEKWDRVKIVCSQPFNNHIKYGLSFVVLHSSDGSASSKESNSGDKKNNNEVPEVFGAFKLKSTDKEDDKVRIGSLFNKMKEASKDKTPPADKTSESNNTGPLAIRNASVDPPKNDKNPLTPAAKSKISSRSETSNKVSQNGQTSSQREQSPFTPKPKKPSDHSTNHKKDIPKEETEEKKKDSPKSSHSASKRKADDSQGNKEKPFHRIMDGVIFVLSGYQNPQRGQIRDQALAMGASYRQDWGKGCTHLICAFANTPKYKQVESLGGRIVSHKWISESFKRKKVQQWRKYRLEAESSDDSSSEEESSESEEEVKPKKSKHNSSKSSKNKTKDQSSSSKSTSKNDSKIDDDSDEVYLASTDVDDESESGGESGGDTEDELNRVKANLSVTKSSNTGKNDTANLSLPPLPEFFKNHLFYLHGDFKSEKRKKLERYVIGCGGKISVYMNEEVNFVLSDSDWVKEFDEALSENKKIKIVKPSWVDKCLKRGDFVSTTDYLIKRKR